MFKTKRIGKWVFTVSIWWRFELGFQASKYEFVLMVGPVRLSVFR